MKKWIIAALMAMLSMSSFAQYATPSVKHVKKQKKVKPAIVHLNVTSAAFANNDIIPWKYTCRGQHISPPLTITKIPSGAKSLALIVYDFEFNPQSGFAFWIIWNMGTSGDIPEGFSNAHQTVNAAGRYGYTPICADTGTHKYHFIVYALDCELALNENTTKPMIEKVMKGHILGKGELVGTYNKQIRP